MKDWGSCVLTFPGNIQVPTFKCLEVLFNNILITVVSLSGLAMLVMFLIGGFKYITSAGNPEAAAAGKQTITYAIIGMFLLAIAYLVFALIKFFTGVDVLKFTIQTT
jgi:hypothetical protein